MKNKTILKFGFVVLILSLLWVTVMWNNSLITVKEQKIKIDILTNRSDSLYDENFLKSVELGRDELTWEYVKEKFPNAYNNAMNFKSNETE